ncbi:MAG: ATP phosphoribosyltransferase [Flavobacteriales bacterium]|nr:ATP phosphoribosyltransferase [Flavobacteriales bacterium]
MKNETVLKIAIQKSGRLSEKSLDLLKSCGVNLNGGDRKLITIASNFPLEVFFLRDDDIPQYVADGVADLGILGENEVFEKNQPVEVIKKLGFAKCRMCLATRREVDYHGIEWFEGKKIATSYPVILQDYLNKNKVNASIEVIGGSVEIAPGIGLADGIFDIVSTGSTLIMNGLKEVETVIKSQAVLIGNQDISQDKKALLNQLLFRMDAVNTAKKNKYILLNAPNDKVDDIIKIIPGMRSPTVLPLAMEGWSSVHTVIQEDDFWEVIEQLKENGAEGILVSPIEKMIL